MATSLNPVNFSNGTNPNLGPIYSVPNDIVALFFSFLDIKNKAPLGQTCKWLNTAYLQHSPVASNCKQLFAVLVTPAHGLALATLARTLSTKELLRANLPKQQLSPTEQAASDALEKTAKEQFEVFKTAYSIQIGSININPESDQHRTLQKFAKNLFISCCKKIKSEEELKEQFHNLKIKTVTEDFNNHTFIEICNSYSKLPIDKITIESFKRQVTNIQNCYPIDKIDYFKGSEDYMKGTYYAYDIPNIETQLRQGILAQHESALKNAVAKFKAAATDNQDPLFIAARAAIETKLTAEKRELTDSIQSDETASDDEKAKRQEKVTAIQAKLQTDALDSAATLEVTKTANFYNELCLTIPSFLKVRRSAALHAVIDQ